MPKRSRTKYIKGTPEERFWPKVDRDGPLAPLDPELGQCWAWLAGIDDAGCPRFADGSGRVVNARKWVYTRHFGVPPKGYVIAAVCGTPDCVKPEHIRALTKSGFHSFQADLVKSRGGRRRSEFCKKGLHPLPPQGHCQPCREKRIAEYNEAAKEKYAPRQKCQYGHPYEQSSTSSGKHRVCATCRAEREARVCSVGNCEEPHRFYGYCELHGRRWKQTGSTDDPVRSSDAERFWSKVDRDGDHWMWIGGGSAATGSFRDREAKRAISPRKWAWIDANGPLPRGHGLWPGCGVIQCVRPDHARLATRAEIAAERADSRTSCSNGHARTSENIRVTPAGTRVCRICHRDKERLRHVAGTDGVEYVSILRKDPCSYCGAPSEHIDHIIPVTKGGASHWTNLTAACSACNRNKMTSDLLGFLLRRSAS